VWGIDLELYEMKCITSSYHLLAGVNLAKLPEGKYAIIVSTFEPGGKGKYHLLVYSDDSQSSVSPLTAEWLHKKELKVSL